MPWPADTARPPVSSFTPPRDRPRSGADASRAPAGVVGPSDARYLPRSPSHSIPARKGNAHETCDGTLLWTLSSPVQQAVARPPAHQLPFMASSSVRVPDLAKPLMLRVQRPLSSCAPQHIPQRSHGDGWPKSGSLPFSAAAFIPVPRRYAILVQHSGVLICPTDSFYAVMPVAFTLSYNIAQGTTRPTRGFYTFAPRSEFGHVSILMPCLPLFSLVSAPPLPRPALDCLLRRRYRLICTGRRPWALIRPHNDAQPACAAYRITSGGNGSAPL